VSWVLILVALLLGGTHVVEARWGLEAALVYEFVAASVWLLVVLCWLAFGRGRRNRRG